MQSSRKKISRTWSVHSGVVGVCPAGSRNLISQELKKCGGNWRTSRCGLGIVGGQRKGSNVQDQNRLRSRWETYLGNMMGWHAAEIRENLTVRFSSIYVSSEHPCRNSCKCLSVYAASGYSTQLYLNTLFYLNRNCRVLGEYYIEQCIQQRDSRRNWKVLPVQGNCDRVSWL